MYPSQLKKLGDQATEYHYRRLWSGGDCFEAWGLPRLRRTLGYSLPVDQFEDERLIAAVYRWVLRGLPLAMAIRKVSIDRQAAAERREASEWASLGREFVRFAF